MKKVVGWLKKMLEPRPAKKESGGLRKINYLNYIPFVRVLIPFVIGIILKDFGYISTFLILITIFLIYYFSYIKHTLFQLEKSILAISIYFSFFFLGNIIAFNKEDSLQRHHFSKEGTCDLYQIQIRQIPAQKNKYIQTIGEVTGIIKQNKLIACKGKINVTLFYDTLLINSGNFIYTAKAPQIIDPPSNPDEFNYQKYMERKGVLYHLSLYKNDEIYFTSIETDFFSDLYLKIKNNIQFLFQKYIKENEQSNVAGAIIFGYKEELNSDLIQAYSETGTLHVLAVSGLHVGIVFLIIKNILARFIRKKKSNWIQGFIIIIGLWFYAFITGFSPSVLRAAIMFTFITLGVMLNKKMNVYNSLAASALGLLIFDPDNIYDIGFQLSYSAVTAIIFIQPILYKIWLPNNILLQYLWALITVSLAAQMGTAPISIYYFHQFPLYFLISNLIVVPLTTIATYLGLLVILFSFSDFTGELLGYITHTVIDWTDNLVKYISSWPYASIKNLNVNLFQVGILYVLIICFIHFLDKKRSKIYIFFSLGIFFLSLSYESFYSYRQREIWVYSINKHQVIDLMNGSGSKIYSDQLLGTENKIYNQKIANHHIQEGIKYKEFHQISDNLFSEGIIFVQLNSETRKTKRQILYILKNRAANSKLLRNAEFIILGHQLSNEAKKDLEKGAQKLKLPSWDLKKQGAFRWEVK